LDFGLTLGSLSMPPKGTGVSVKCWGLNDGDETKENKVKKKKKY